MNKEQPLIIVLGPTASGKTSLGVSLAQALQGEIISADSRQVFTGMDIGTGKDLHEYGNIPYHLIDITKPGSEFSVFDFLNAYKQSFEQINSHQKQALLVGGTGLYLDSVINDYQMTYAPNNSALRSSLVELTQEQLNEKLQQLKPEGHNNTDLLERERTIRAIEVALAEQAGTAKLLELPACDKIILGIKWSRDELKQRITSRLKERLAQGMITEVQQLHEQGVSWEMFNYYGLEYRFIAAHLKGELSYNDMFQKLNSAIHYFSKQQTKWFRRMEKKGANIHWLKGDKPLLAQAVDALSKELDI